VRANGIRTPSNRDATFMFPLDVRARKLDVEVGIRRTNEILEAGNGPETANVFLVRLSQQSSHSALAKTSLNGIASLPPLHYYTISVIRHTPIHKVNANV